MPFVYPAGAAELVSHKGEQAAIYEARTMKARGSSLRAIAEALRAKGQSVSHVAVNRVISLVERRSDHEAPLHPRGHGDRRRDRPRRAPRRPLIPTPADQNPLAQSRSPMDMIVQGRLMSLWISCVRVWQRFTACVRPVSN